jgi:hypothetical protein
MLFGDQAPIMKPVGWLGVSRAVVRVGEADVIRGDENDPEDRE